MNYRIFLAGASGAIGSRLIPLLRDAGHHVVGATRVAARADQLRDQGADPVVVDVFDAAGLLRAVTTSRPDIVINQLTDLPRDLDPARMGEAIARNAHIRDEGTRNLVRAALAAGARRFIAQSIAWAYAPGREPHLESDPLDVEARGDRRITVHGVMALEDSTLHAPPLEGIVLRYGRIYGPGTHTDSPPESMPVHVDAAAYAAFLALDRGTPGVFNIAQSNAHVATDKARTELGWIPDFRYPAS